MNKCSKCKHCTGFDIYCKSSGVYWYIKTLTDRCEVCVTICYSDGCTDSIECDTHIIHTNPDTNPDTNPTNGLSLINIDTCRRIKSISLTYNKIEYIINNFRVTCKECEESSGYKSGCVVCGCFDGLTLKHNRLLRYASSFDKVIVYVDEGSVHDTKHHSHGKFVNSLKERIEAVRICLIQHKNNLDLISVRPRVKKMSESIHEASNKLIDDGCKDIYYVCGSDQAEYIDRKLPDGMTCYNIERNPISIDVIKSHPFPNILNTLDISILNGYPKSHTSWFSSSIIRKQRSIKRTLDVLGIDIKPCVTRKCKNQNCNPIHLTSYIPFVTVFALKGYSNAWNVLDVRCRVDQMEKPIRLNPSLLSLLSGERLLVCLPGRSSFPTQSSICQEFRIGMDVIKHCEHRGVAKFVTVNYNDRSTTSGVWLNNMYNDPNGLYYNDDACQIALGLFGPMFSSTLCRIGNKFYGEKIDISLAQDNLSKITILSRSLGSAMTHMISSAMYIMMTSIGYTRKEIIGLLSSVISLDMGNIVNPYDKLCRFTHIKFQGDKDVSAKEKLLMYRAEFPMSSTCKICHVKSLIDPYVIKHDHIKNYDRLPDHKIQYKHHMSLSYIGDSSLINDVNTINTIRSYIIDSVNR